MESFDQRGHTELITPLDRGDTISSSLTGFGSYNYGYTTGRGNNVTLWTDLHSSLLQSVFDQYFILILLSMSTWSWLVHRHKRSNLSLATKETLLGPLHFMNRTPLIHTSLMIMFPPVGCSSIQTLELKSIWGIACRPDLTFSCLRSFFRSILCFWLDCSIQTWELRALG